MRSYAMPADEAGLGLPHSWSCAMCRCAFIISKLNLIHSPRAELHIVQNGASLPRCEMQLGRSAATFCTTLGIKEVLVV
jgi:hypothetical protein